MVAEVDTANLARAAIAGVSRQYPNTVRVASRWFRHGIGCGYFWRRGIFHDDAAIHSSTGRYKQVFAVVFNNVVLVNTRLQRVGSRKTVVGNCGGLGANTGDVCHAQQVVVGDLRKAIAHTAE